MTLIFQPEWLDLPDYELGDLIIRLFIICNAEAAGLSPTNIPTAYAEGITSVVQNLPDDYDGIGIGNEALFMALRLAGHGNFESAGKKLRAFMERGAMDMARIDMLASLEEDTKRGIKVRRSARLGGEAVHGDPVKVAERSRDRLNLIDDIRRNNPHLSNQSVHKLAESKSVKVLGEKVGYKTFERAENKRTK